MRTQLSVAGCAQQRRAGGSGWDSWHEHGSRRAGDRSAAPARHRWCSRLKAPCTPRAHDTLLGAFTRVHLAETTMPVPPGAALVLYTDGITEARGRAGRYGEDRLVICNATRHHDGGSPG